MLRDVAIKSISIISSHWTKSRHTKHNNSRYYDTKCNKFTDTISVATTIWVTSKAILFILPFLLLDIGSIMSIFNVLTIVVIIIKSWNIRHSFGSLVTLDRVNRSGVRIIRLVRVQLKVSLIDS